MTHPNTFFLLGDLQCLAILMHILIFLADYYTGPINNPGFCRVNNYWKIHLSFFNKGQLRSQWIWPVSARLWFATDQFDCRPNSPKAVRVPIKITDSSPSTSFSPSLLPFLFLSHTFFVWTWIPTLARLFLGPSWPLTLPPPTSHHEKTYNRCTVWVKASSLLAPSDPFGVTGRRHVLTEVIGGLGWDSCLVFRGDCLGCRSSGQNLAVRPLASLRQQMFHCQSLPEDTLRQTTGGHLSFALSSQWKSQTLTSGGAGWLSLPQMAYWMCEVCYHAYTTSTSHSNMICCYFQGQLCLSW